LSINVTAQDDHIVLQGAVLMNEGVPTPVIITMLVVTVIAAAIVSLALIHFCAQPNQIPIMWQ
jgi:NaMN:DMB phosphoribosyltransferase